MQYCYGIGQQCVEIADRELLALDVESGVNFFDLAWGLIATGMASLYSIDPITPNSILNNMTLCR